MSSEAHDAEQQVIDTLYERLDDLAGEARERLATLERPDADSGQERLDAEAVLAAAEQRILRLSAAEQRLVFGRLDLGADEVRYIGRIGLFAPEDHSRALLIDWRARQAEPFYLATAVDRMGVRRRRHITIEDRQVTRVDDELLDTASAPPERDGLVGDAALMAAVSAHRTGRMRDIVATIQSDQDRIIRADDRRVLVVQGGPGTGKTAVALHRAAYLLYRRREQLAHRGVLVIGPNQAFLNYIDQVLPSLGETGVVLSTIGTLLPGIRVHGAEGPEVVEIKGRRQMAAVVARAVSDRQRIPDEPIGLTLENDEVVLDAATCGPARERARNARLTHNEARPIFMETMLDRLADQVAERVGADVFGGGNLLDSADVAAIRKELSEDGLLAAELDTLWPVLSAEDLIGDLLESPDLLESAAGSDLDAREVRLLLRPDGRRWSASDIPLLDEAAELLGHDDRAEQEQAERDRQRRIAYAEGALEVAYGSRSFDSEDIDPDDADLISAFDLMDAELLAERDETVDDRSQAERAAADRTWVYGHVIIDEAQELSMMDWRMILRRCPSHSITAVGDTAQTSSSAGTTSWTRRLGDLFGDRWSLHELTVNYRNPIEISRLADGVLHRIDPDIVPPQAVRATGDEPTRRLTPAADVRATLESEIAKVAAGTVAVITPRDTDLGELPEATVVSAPEAKGLEFDAVILLDPDRIAVGNYGLNDLYVALTRATQTLTVVETAAGTILEL